MRYALGVILSLGCGLAVLMVPPTSLAAEEKGSPISWQDSYGLAMELAKQEQKMLFVYFYNPAEPQLELLDRWAAKTEDFESFASNIVFCKVPTDREVVAGGKTFKLVEHEAFSEMLKRPGIAIIDCVEPSQATYGRVVSVLSRDLDATNYGRSPDEFGQAASRNDHAAQSRAGRRSAPGPTAVGERPLASGPSGRIPISLEPPGLDPQPRPPQLGSSISANHRSLGRRHACPRGLCRKLARPDADGCRRGMRLELASLARSLECGQLAPTSFCLRHEAREQRHLVCNRDFCQVGPSSRLAAAPPASAGQRQDCGKDYRGPADSPTKRPVLIFTSSNKGFRSQPPLLLQSYQGRQTSAIRRHFAMARARGKLPWGRGTIATIQNGSTFLAWRYWSEQPNGGLPCGRKTGVAK